MPLAVVAYILNSSVLLMNFVKVPKESKNVPKVPVKNYVMSLVSEFLFLDCGRVHH